MNTSTDKSGGSDTREKKLEIELQAEKQKRLEEFAMEDELALPARFSLSLCKHHGKGELKDHWSATVTLKDHWQGMSHCDVMELVGQFEDRIQPVDHWQECNLDGSAVYSAVWMPHACNYSRVSRNPVQKGQSAVEVCSHGTAKLHSRAISFWIQTKNGTWVEFGLTVAAMPQQWEARPIAKGFSTIDGSCTKLEIEAPRGIPDAYVRTGMGSSDSWRMEKWWPTVEAFRDAFRRAAHAL